MSQSQKQYLLDIKQKLGNIRWNDLAELSGINPRALKTYRMPETSKDYRSMPLLAFRALQKTLEDFEKNQKS